jgi:hypothetical protein
VYVASQRLEQLLELMANDGDTRPMVVTSKDRLDIVMGLLASQVCAEAYCRLRPHAPQQGHTCAVRWCQAGCAGVYCRLLHLYATQPEHTCIIRWCCSCDPAGVRGVAAASSKCARHVLACYTAAQVSVAGPNVACILLTHAGPRVSGVHENGYAE